MKFGERLDAAMQHLGWGPSDLSRTSGVDMPTISALIKRGSERSKYQEALVKGFPPDKISYAWLRDETGKMIEEEETSALEPAQADCEASHATNGSVVITRYDTGGGMNSTGRLLLESEPPGIIKSWRVDREWLRLNVPSYTSIENLCIVTGFGPSMKPMYNPGDPLLMDRGVHVVDHEGVYFFRVGDEGYIKIIQRVPDFDGPGFKLRVISKNPDFSPYDLSPKNPHLYIIGKILTVWKSEQF